MLRDPSRGGEEPLGNQEEGESREIRLFSEAIFKNVIGGTGKFG
jgi:hypothetical protein